jgi:chromosome segregation ATPase
MAEQASSTSQALTTGENAVREMEITQHVTMALGKMESAYKERISAFADELHHLSAKIDKLTKEIALLEKAKATEEQVVEILGREIDSELKFLERQTDQILRKAEVTAELQSELNTLSSAESEHLLRSRHLILKELNKEIEETEIILLQKELERENRELELEPKRQQIRTLQMQINELQAQKRYIESSGMHKLTQPTLPDKQPDTQSDVIDTDIDTAQG